MRVACQRRCGTRILRVIHGRDARATFYFILRMIHGCYARATFYFILRVIHGRDARATFYFGERLTEITTTNTSPVGPMLSVPTTTGSPSFRLISV